MRTIEEIWREYDDVESRLTANVSERMLDLAGLQPGMRVLDLATGRGEPALRAARRVGPRGRVVGIELSAGLLQIAREKAEGDGLANLDLRVGNAEQLDGVRGDPFDAVTIRWGLMFMDAPVVALTHAREVLSPRGALVAALWAEPERVPWSTLPRSAIARHRPLPPIDPEAPGTFRYADLERIVRDFDLAGLAIDHVEEIDVAVFEAPTAAELVAWARALVSSRLLQDLPAADQRAWEDELTRELERTRDGALLRLGGVTRLVRARPRLG